MDLRIQGGIIKFVDDTKLGKGANTKIEAYGNGILGWNESSSSSCSMETNGRVCIQVKITKGVIVEQEK